MNRNISSHEDWVLINRRLVAKALGELIFEEVLTCVQNGGDFRVSLPNAVQYRFRGWWTIWSFPRIEVDSVERQGSTDEVWEAVTCAGQFFLDVQTETGMDAIILGNFLEEMHRTLFADLRLLKAQRCFSAAAMVAMDGERLQSLLDGHPKALLNKGRLGWGQPDIERFAPESMAEFQLFWLAVRREKASLSLHPDWTWERIAAESMSPAERLVWDEDYALLPVHPWQWEQVISQQFAGAIAARDMIPLGYLGDRYRPQISLRTLSNTERPEKLQIKLSLSVLNTSSIRGLPAQAVAMAPVLAAWLAEICAQDDALQGAGTRVLRDVAGIHVAHDVYQKVSQAPYRYHEQLGAIWRESVQAHLAQGEQAVLTAALFQKDAEGQALIAVWIKQSGLSIADWLRAYFERIVVPLYHLQCKYGVGLVAHGQNILVRLHGGRPLGLLIKDLQGDLRLVDEDWPELETLPREVRARITRLPPHYLIHDLQTGHFITVLRFMSATLQEATGFPEARFYRILATCVDDYQKEWPELAARFAASPLLEPRVKRVLINRVRFKIGYADDAERPLPMLGTDLNNPLYGMPDGDGDVRLSL